MTTKLNSNPQITPLQPQSEPAESVTESVTAESAPANHPEGAPEPSPELSPEPGPKARKKNRWSNLVPSRKLRWRFGLAALFTAAALGPQPRVDKQVDKQIQLPALKQLPAWLDAAERTLGDVTDGAEKTIQWADPTQPAKTPLSVVYLHGFSATRQEIAPVNERLATQLGANLFLTRLSGHGRSNEAMGLATANDWLNDAWQAWQVAELLGERVLVIATSTGGTLATWLAQQPEVQDKLAGIVLISPNFGPRDKRANLLLTPWARQWVPKVLGDEHSWQPVSELADKYWTSRYSVNALFEMQALVKYVRDMGGHNVKVPTLFTYSYADNTVSPEQIDVMYQQWGSANKQRQIIEDEDGQSPHVLAGDILSPERTDGFVAMLKSFAHQL